ncbi:MAG: protein kinase domain containing protein [Gammaproteobacteria bacterium]|jgi:WD40 repeat protein|nr:protein kinase domain containing protein [Gammaproteobacteria bacterium]
MNPFNFDEKTQTALAEKGGECLATWKGHERHINVLAALENGWVLSGSGDLSKVDNTIKCWELDRERGEARCLATWQGHESDVGALAVLENGWVLSGNYKKIKCWDIDKKTGEARCLATGQGRGAYICALAVLENGWVLSGGGGYGYGEIECWEVDRKTGEARCLATWQRPHRDNVFALAVLPDGRVLSGSGDKKIKCWDVDRETGNATCLATWGGHTNLVLALVVLPNKWVLSGSQDGTIKCWDTTKIRSWERYHNNTGNLHCLATWEGHRNSVCVLAVFANGWILSGGKDRKIKCWKIDKETGNAACLATWEGHVDSINALAVLPNGWVLSGSQDGAIKCWRGVETLFKKTLFELLSVARVFLVQSSSQPDLPLEVKLHILEKVAMNMSYRLPKKIVRRCFDYVADRATLREKALTQRGFLKYVSYAPDDKENIQSLFKTPAYLESKAKYYLGLQYKEGDFEDISQQEASREILYWFSLAAQEGVAEAILELKKMPELADNIVSNNSLLESQNASCNTSSALPAEYGQKSPDGWVRSEKMESSFEEDDGSKKYSRSAFERASFFTMATSESVPLPAKEEEKNTPDNNPDYGLDKRGFSFLNNL